VPKNGNESGHQDVLTRATLGERRGAQSHQSKGLTYDSGTTGTTSASLVDVRSCIILHYGSHARTSASSMPVGMSIPIGTRSVG
jgi:hypothetical protein